VRPHGKTKLGFFPLPTAEAERLRNCFAFACEFSAVDPCVGDGVAFPRLLWHAGDDVPENRAEADRPVTLYVWPQGGFVGTSHRFLAGPVGRQPG
jgi:hypothetical protein